MQGEIISQLIYKLIERQENIAPDTYLISLYLNTYEKSRDEVLSYVNSMLTTKFKENDILRERLDIKKAIYEKIHDECKKIHEFSKGLIIFAKFNDEISDFELLNTNVSPMDDLSIRKVFNLGPLLDIQSKLHRAIILELHTKESKIFHMDEDSLSHVTTIESEYSQSEDMEFQANYTAASSNGSVQHGRGLQNKKQELLEDLKHYWQDIYSRLKEVLEGRNDYEYIVVYHTSTFDFLNETISKDISLLVKDYIIERSTKSPNNGEMIRNTTELITKYNMKKKRKLYSTLSKEIDLVSKDLKQIVDASRDGNIQMLFINPELILSGFVTTDNLIYLDKQEKSREVNNIVPRLIQRVMETSGEIIVYSKPALAKLRFKTSSV